MYLILGLIIFLIVCYKHYRTFQYWKEQGIPQERPWPIFGNMAGFSLRITSIPDFIQHMYKNHNSKMVGFYQFTAPGLLIKDINLLKHLAIKEFDSFPDHRILFDVEHVEPLFKNLLSLKGQKWKDMRSILSPAFTSSKMRSMFNLMSTCAEQFTNHFTLIADLRNPITVEMKDAYTRYANDVIATCAFGIKCDSLKNRENEFYLMGKESASFVGFKNFIFIAYSTFPTLMKYFNVRLFSDEVSRFFREIITNTIRTREEQNIIRPDLIHLLMEARKGRLRHEHDKQTESMDGYATVKESNVERETHRSKPELTDDDITSQAMLFFVAGFDTAANLLCFMSYELALNTDIQQKLQEEIDDTLENCDGQITYEVIQRMKYMDMVMSESLRKWPPAAMTDRLCTKAYTIQPDGPNGKSVHIKQDDVLWIPIYSIHRDPQYYPNPEKFEPERFSDANKSNIKPFTYIPFGIGPRNCIGSRFALLEAKIIFCYFLAKFDIVVVDKTAIPFRFSRKQFSVNSEDGFWLGLKLRNIVKVAE